MSNPEQQLFSQTDIDTAVAKARRKAEEDMVERTRLMARSFLTANKIFLAMGDDLSGAMQSLGYYCQMKFKNVVDPDDFLWIAERTPRVIDAICRGLNMTPHELLEAARNKTLGISELDHCLQRAYTNFMKQQGEIT